MNNCEILDLPGGLQLNLLGLRLNVERVRLVADRSGLLGNLLASLTCGSPAELEALMKAVQAAER